MLLCAEAIPVKLEKRVCKERGTERVRERMREGALIRQHRFAPGDKHLTELVSEKMKKGKSKGKISNFKLIPSFGQEVMKPKAHSRVSLSLSLGEKHF